MPKRWLSVLGISVGMLGGYALYLLLTSFWPSPATRVLFLALLFITAAAISLPVSVYLNYRFARPDWPQRDRFRLLRQAFWVGAFFGTSGWLLTVRALNSVLILVLIGVFTLIEIYFLTRE